jgi:Brp/Blh family beta-carotene 15,15'-monooxygenase
MNVRQLVRESNFLPMFVSVALLHAVTWYTGAGNNPWILLIGLAVGMPHGATDLLGETTRWNLKAALFYGAGISVLLLFWLTWPGWTLGLFLVVSIVHFGTEDALSRQWSWLHVHESAVRGSLVVLLPSLFYREEVLELFYMVSGTDWSAILAPNVINWGLNLWFIGLFSLFGHAATHWPSWERVLQTFLELGLLVIVFRILHPLEAFVVYFVAGHSLRTAFKLRQVLTANWLPVVSLTLATFGAAALYHIWMPGQIELDAKMIRTAFVRLIALRHSPRPVADLDDF